jgi:putative membrane protein
MINLIQAYTVAIKHALRGEPGAYYADLYPLVAWLPHFAGTNHVQANESDWMPIWASSRDIQFEDKRPAMPMHNQYSSLRSAMPRLGEGRRDSDTTLNDGDLGRLNLSGRSKQVDIESSQSYHFGSAQD